MNKILSKEVSFELAKLLKEKGFEERAEKRYGTKSIILYNDALINDLEDNVFTAAPTIGQVIDLVLEKYGIWIKVECDCYGELWYAKLLVASQSIWENYELRSEINMASLKIPECKSPLHSYEEAIKHILLNLIK